jgi:hypothetical protein
VREINLSQPDILPFAPYWLDCHALDDSKPEERARGMKNGMELLRRGFIDEVWLFGERLSLGMAAEVKIAQEAGIPVISQSTYITI